MFFFLLASVCSLFSLVAALVVSPVTRDVWSPQIWSPAADTVWYIGCTQTVAWDPSNPPSEITDSEGQIYLRINGETQSTPLAQGFPLSAGWVEVIVPSDTQPSNQWEIVRK